MAHVKTCDFCEAEMEVDDLGSIDLTDHENDTICSFDACSDCLKAHEKTLRKAMGKKL